jgi:hypothetical protein
MPPEEPHDLIALELDIENGIASCRGVRVFPSGRLKVSWYTELDSLPEGYPKVLNGVVFV